MKRISHAIQTIAGYAKLAAMIATTVTISVAVAATLYVAVVAALAAMGIVIVVAFLARMWGMPISTAIKKNARWAIFFFTGSGDSAITGSSKPNRRTQEMARYILIDNNSGFIFGDTKNMNCSRSFKTPAEAAKMLDESIGEPASEYVEIYGDHDTSGKSGYSVYSVDDIEDMTEVEDGTDQATIDKFCRKCERVCFVETICE